MLQSNIIMDLENLRDYCLAKKGVTEGFPYGEPTLVFKVASKHFVLTSINDEVLSFNVKCDPEKAIELREKYEWVQPGYHMNKKHWNTVNFNGSNTKLLKELIDHSYDEVVKGMTKKEKLELENL